MKGKLAMSDSEDALTTQRKDPLKEPTSVSNTSSGLDNSNDHLSKSNPRVMNDIDAFLLGGGSSKPVDQEIIKKVDEDFKDFEFDIMDQVLFSKTGSTASSTSPLSTSSNIVPAQDEVAPRSSLFERGLAEQARMLRRNTVDSNLSSDEKNRPNEEPQRDDMVEVSSEEFDALLEEIANASNLAPSSPQDVRTRQSHSRVNSIGEDESGSLTSPTTANSSSLPPSPAISSPILPSISSSMQSISSSLQTVHVASAQSQSVSSISAASHSPYSSSPSSSPTASTPTSPSVTDPPKRTVPLPTFIRILYSDIEANYVVS